MLTMMLQSSYGYDIFKENLPYSRQLTVIHLCLLILSKLKQMYETSFFVALQKKNLHLFCKKILFAHIICTKAKHTVMQ